MEDDLARTRVMRNGWLLRCISRSLTFRWFSVGRCWRLTMTRKGTRVESDHGDHDIFFFFICLAFLQPFANATLRIWRAHNTIFAYLSPSPCSTLAFNSWRRWWSMLMRSRQSWNLFWTPLSRLHRGERWADWWEQLIFLVVMTRRKLNDATIQVSNNFSSENLSCCVIELDVVRCATER